MATWVTVDRLASEDEQLTAVLSDDGTQTFTLQLAYICVTDQTSRASADEALTSGVPTLGSTITGASGRAYTVNNVRPARTGPFSFTVQVQAVCVATFQPTDKSNVHISFSGQQYTQDAYHDKDNKAVVNSAGQTFDPSMTQVIYDERIEVSYTTTFDQSGTFADARGKVNSDSVSFNIKGISRSFEPRGLLLEDVKLDDTLPLSNGTPCYQVSASFLARSDTWKDKILDQGFYTLNDGGELVAVKDADGNPVTQPVRLDGNGNVLGDGDDPVFCEFKLQGETSFASLFTGLS